MIRRDERESQRGSIIIPENARKPAGWGVVIATGPGSLGKDGTRIPLETQVGDRVLFNAQLGHDVEIDGDRLTVLSEDGGVIAREERAS